MKFENFYGKYYHLLPVFIYSYFLLQYVFKMIDNKSRDDSSIIGSSSATHII
jgi:hypothetical protein